ncbi:MAG: Bifunctional ligase/repressor BirA [Chlamydiia bacterium]|nr:Bifunctional ligase/repressor BirA [Chlamydiia bacterium]MCH9616191.1 Bifunctional ligase/repressor BirA [Chlamydiia bacterium]MCH9629823.1 Bifunctional ligase/repressor BirA [Chlamydiia bacterium]
MDFNFEEIESTQTWAHDNLDAFNLDEVNFVVAKRQTKGRGQFERSWVSLEGNIFLTMVFRLTAFDSKELSLGTGHAVQNALKELGFTASLKWPNDILLEGKKVGGILIETVPLKEERVALVGVGLNVNLEDFSTIDQSATSLKVASGIPYEVEKVLKVLKDNLTKKLSSFISSK